MTTRYCFFGTLMDPDVLRLVLGRPVTRGALAPAPLHGYRRLRILRDSLPVLVADPPAAVQGLVLPPDGAPDADRILVVADYDTDLAPSRQALADRKNGHTRQSDVEGKRGA